MSQFQVMHSLSAAGVHLRMAMNAARSCAEQEENPTAKKWFAMFADFLESDSIKLWTQHVDLNNVVGALGGITIEPVVCYRKDFPEYGKRKEPAR